MITDAAGRTTPPDHSPVSKLDKSERGGEGGSDFSLTLSNLNRKDSPQSDEAPEGQEHSSTDDESASERGEGARMKPIIDLKPETLRRQSAAGEEVLRGNAGRSEGVDRKSIRDRLQASGAGQTAANAKPASQQNASKDETGEAEQSSSTDQVQADVPKAAALAEMLSLLAGGEHPVAAEAVAGGPKPGGALGARRGTASAETAGADGVSPRRTDAGTEDADLLSMPKSDPETGVSRDRLFRFSNARANGQSVDMSIGGGRGEKTTVEFKNSTGAAAENVTVLDSRRFLGLAPSSNSALLTGTLSGDPEWVSAMQPGSALSNAAAHSSTGSVVNTLKLQMNPHDLGSVTATLRLVGEELNVHLTVETRAAYRQLSDDSGGILDALRAQGFSVDQVTISIAATADSDTAKGQQNGQGQPMTANGGHHQEAQQGRAQGETGRQTASGATGNENDMVTDNAAAVASDGSRSGQLYL